MIGRERTILIVDDEPSSLELLDFLLKKENYQTVLFGKAEEALQHAKKNPPDLVISDLLMPTMNGTDLCRALRADPFTKDVPFLFLSAVTSEKDIEEGIRAGADSFIVKPFNPDRIVDKIKELCRNPR